MPITPGDWAAALTSKPLSNVLADLEAKLAAYTDSQVAAGEPTPTPDPTPDPTPTPTPTPTGSPMDQHLYVKKSGSDTAGDGKSWETAFATLGKALDALGAKRVERDGSPGQINLGPGTFTESNVVTAEGIAIVGTVRRFMTGTVLEAPDGTSDILTFKNQDCRVENLHFMGRGGTQWNATALLIDSGGYLNGRNLLFRHGANFASATTGGTGIHILNAEGCRFEGVGFSEFRLGLDLDYGANQNTFIDLHGSGNWMDLWIHDQYGGNNPGGNEFIRFKSVYAKRDLTTLLDTTSNGNLFVGADWSESPGDHHVDIRSNHNTFILGSTSPQATWNVYSNNNIFDHFWIQNTLNIQGNENHLIDPALVGVALNVTGTGNVVDHPWKTGGEIKVGAGNVVSNPRGIPITGSGYKQTVYENKP